MYIYIYRYVICGATAYLRPLCVACLTAYPAPPCSRTHCVVGPTVYSARPHRVPAAPERTCGLLRTSGPDPNNLAPLSRSEPQAFCFCCRMTSLCYK